MQIGDVPEEAGAYVFRKNDTAAATSPKSRVSESARDALVEAARKLTPEQRLNAMLEQTQLVSELHVAGRKAEIPRARKPGRAR
jgi:histone acetyltransferase (RNA polymerase elongator complex component)